MPQVCLKLSQPWLNGSHYSCFGIRLSHTPPQWMLWQSHVYSELGYVPLDRAGNVGALPCSGRTVLLCIWEFSLILFCVQSVRPSSQTVPAPGRTVRRSWLLSSLLFWSVKSWGWLLHGWWEAGRGSRDPPQVGGIFWFLGDARLFP